MTPTEARKKNKGTSLSQSQNIKIQEKDIRQGYTPNWTEQMFVIDEFKYTYPITNTITDLNDEEIKQSF